MLAFGGGFVALSRLLVRSESGTNASALAWLGLAVTIAAGTALAILRVVDGMVLKRAVNSWYAVAPANGEEKTSPFELQKGLSRLRLASIVCSEFVKEQLE